MAKKVKDPFDFPFGANAPARKSSGKKTGKARKSSGGKSGGSGGGWAAYVGAKK